jgi:hypothetical protein
MRAWLEPGGIAMPYHQVGAAALTKAGYWQRGTGEWRITNCAVTLRDTGQGIWSIEIRSRCGVVAVTAAVKDMQVQDAASL